MPKSDISDFGWGEGWDEGASEFDSLQPLTRIASQSDLSPQAGRGEKKEIYLVPNVVAPNSAFCVEGCERQYCGGTETSPPSSAAACQPQRGS